MTSDEPMMDASESGAPDRGEMDSLLAQLGPESRSALLDDLVEVIWTHRSSEGAQPMIHVLRTWLVDTRVVNRPGFEERLKQRGGKIVTQEQLLRRVGGV